MPESRLVGPGGASAGTGAIHWTVEMEGLPDHTGDPGTRGTIHVYGDSYEDMNTNFSAWLIEHNVKRKGALFTRWEN